jgi:hypothetical protein
MFMFIRYCLQNHFFGVRFYELNNDLYQSFIHLILSSTTYSTCLVP